MKNNNIFIGAIFLVLGVVIGVISISIINANGVTIDSIEDSEGNIIGQAIANQIKHIPIRPPSPPTVTSSSSSGGKVKYIYAGSLNYCVDRNSAVTAYVDWTDEIRKMDLGLNTFTIKFSNKYYYKINFCKVEVGQYDNCEQCMAELDSE